MVLSNRCLFFIQSIAFKQHSSDKTIVPFIRPLPPSDFYTFELLAEIIFQITPKLLYSLNQQTVRVHGRAIRSEEDHPRCSGMGWDKSAHFLGNRLAEAGLFLRGVCDNINRL